MKRLLVMFAVMTAAIYVGCKQQDGQRCQVNEDCESDVCNQAKGTCSGGGNDKPVDASIPDGTDAPNDAAMADAPDAM